MLISFKRSCRRKDGDCLEIEVKLFLEGNVATLAFQAGARQTRSHPILRLKVSLHVRRIRKISVAHFALPVLWRLSVVQSFVGVHTYATAATNRPRIRPLPDFSSVKTLRFCTHALVGENQENCCFSPSMNRALFYQPAAVCPNKSSTFLSN